MYTMQSAGDRGEVPTFLPESPRSSQGNLEERLIKSYQSNRAWAILTGVAAIAVVVSAVALAVFFPPLGVPSFVGLGILGVAFLAFGVTSVVKGIQAAMTKAKIDKLWNSNGSKVEVMDSEDSSSEDDELIITSFTPESADGKKTAKHVEFPEGVQELSDEE